jgi:transcriptional regulator with XRE-family HTH domain
MEAHGRLSGEDPEKIAKEIWSRSKLAVRQGIQADAALLIRCIDIFHHARWLADFCVARMCADLAQISYLPEDTDLVTMTHPVMLPTMNIGETIRNYRLQKGMSQGDIEKRTGLLRCYLSRVENGHTIPSLDTLSKIAGAMELPLSQFFAEPGHSNGSKGLPQLSDDEVRFLSQIRRYSTSLNDSDRKLVLAMVKKMASNSGK